MVSEKGHNVIGVKFDTQCISKTITLNSSNPQNLKVLPGLALIRQSWGNDAELNVMINENY